jgi:hypothetical protein
MALTKYELLLEYKSLQSVNGCPNGIFLVPVEDNIFSIVNNYNFLMDIHV